MLEPRPVAAARIVMLSTCWSCFDVLLFLEFVLSSLGLMSAVPFASRTVRASKKMDETTFTKQTPPLTCEARRLGGPQVIVTTGDTGDYSK